MEEMNANFNDPGSTPPASGVPDSLTEWQWGSLQCHLVKPDLITQG
jgi:hypothetical protein